MAKLPPDAALLLEQLRHVDDPTAAERQRADAGVRNMLAAHGVRRPPPLTQPLAAAGLQPTAATSALKILGVSAAGLVAALSFWGGTLWPARPAQPVSEQQRPHAQAVEESAAKLSPPPASDAPPSQETQPQPMHSVQRAVSRPKLHGSRAAGDSLAEELRFLASVDADIRGGAYEHALRRLAQNKASSPLQEERSAMRVLALCGRDHDGAAARARDQFLKGAPSSLLAARVRSACKDVLP